MSSTLSSSLSLCALTAAASLMLAMEALAALRSQAGKPAHQYIDCSPAKLVVLVEKPVSTAGQKQIALPCSRKPAR